MFDFLIPRFLKMVYKKSASVRPLDTTPYFAVLLTLNNISGLAISAWEREMLSKLGTTGVGTAARLCLATGIPTKIDFYD